MFTAWVKWMVAGNFISLLQKHGNFYSVDDTNVYNSWNWLHGCNGLCNHNGWSLMVTISWIWVSDVRGHLWSQNDAFLSRLMLTATSNCFPHPYWTYTKWLSTLICYPWAYSISITQLYPPYLAQILGFWVTCGVKMMWLCYGWGWQPPQTASHTHIRHSQCIWAQWYTVHWHMVAALHSFTHPTWRRFLGSGSLVVVESKWCDYVMVKADSHLILLPTSILDI